MFTTPIHVIGATGRSGLALCRTLAARGNTIIPVIRNPGRLAKDLPPARIADLTGPRARLAAALSDAKLIVTTAHARHIGAILAASAPDVPLIALGSTRKFTQWPDAHGLGVLAGEKALHDAGRPGILLHPTMIYGAEGEDNVQRLAALLKILPFVPLPEGGRALVQPIYQGDVTRSIVAALDLAAQGAVRAPESLVIAGPEAMPYRNFVQAIARAAGLPRRRILSLPSSLLMAVAPLVARLPKMPAIGRDEIRRLLEDKAFDTEPMRARLGVMSIPFEQGLSQLFTPSS
ncbi:SDR family oxidoreductase [Kozakia baliensis]|uniref:SDR family oxidoreductase n=1 Tax=Kozakia baliensis TaxID=153496 RepID=UPI00087B4619|nr:NADH-ubiquinone oxidoreductase [Kozakia baliensis]AOX20439.1 NADH-ubiquinone oxidoreductase [Kozakia baliensis]